MNDYEARQEARRQRLLDAAAKAEHEANARYNLARRMGDAIPMGQPILVGHHSEGRDRRYRARIHANYGKAFEAQDRAKDLRRRAEAIGHSGISSEDPDAGAKLREKIAKLESDQARMKAANAAIRKHKKDGPAAQIAALVAQGLSAGSAAKLIEPDFCGRVGFPDYALSNNNANIARLKKRLPQVAAIQAAEGVRKMLGQIEYREEEARVWLLFPGKPSAEIRAALRSHGFKWSPSRGAWVRMLSDAARYYANEIAEKAGA